MVVSQRKKTRKQGGDRQQAEDERRVREGGRIEVSGVVGWKWRRGFSERKGESSAGTEKYCVSACPIGDQKKQIFRLDIVNTSACQSQGFPLGLFHFFLSLQTIYTQSSRLHAAHIRVISTLTLEDSGIAASVEASQLQSLFSRLTPAVLIFKTLPRHFFRLWWLYRKAEGLRKAYTSENKGTKKKGVCVIIEETWVTMKDLWQALRAGGGFISLLSTKSPPLRCTTYLLCSALSLLSIPHSLLEINAHPHRHRHI